MSTSTGFLYISPMRIRIFFLHCMIVTRLWYNIMIVVWWRYVVQWHTYEGGGSHGVRTPLFGYLFNWVLKRLKCCVFISLRKTNFFPTDVVNVFRRFVCVWLISCQRFRKISRIFIFRYQFGIIKQGWKIPS